MSKVDLVSRGWCDMIFEGRNKAYGAYYLRSKQGARQFKAIVSVVILVIILIGLPLLVKFATPENKTLEVEVDVTSLSKLEEAKIEDKNVVKKYVEQPQEVQAIKSSVKFTAPVIAKDEEVTKDDGLKSQDELTKAKGVFASKTVIGNDEIAGKNIDDIKEVITSQKVEEEKPFEAVEQMPEFPGGEAALIAYISKHINYPQIALEQDIQGVVVLRFVVLPNGQVGDVKVAKSLERNCDKEAVRVVKSLPRFVPGKQQGRAVAVWYTCPVRFQIR